MIAGSAYGTLLNDRAQIARMADDFIKPPYQHPPLAPVLYIKPRTTFAFGGAPVVVPAELAAVEIAATVGVLFGRALTNGSAGDAQGAITACCLAIDISEPHSDYYRPAIRQRCRDGFLPLGGFSDRSAIDCLTIETFIDGQLGHAWALDRLVRPVAALAAEVSRFMTFEAGDLLLVGLAGDAPQARLGQHVEVRAAGLPSVAAELIAECAR